MTRFLFCSGPDSPMEQEYVRLLMRLFNEGGHAMSSINTGRFAKCGMAAAIALWTVGVLAGALELTRYAGRPGKQTAHAPVYWPDAVALSRDPYCMTLVMVVHPHCPCSRASLHELDRVLAHTQGQLVARVVFIQPAGVPDDWVHSDLWRLASGLPNVTVSVDRDGSIARALNATTSGQIVLYDAAGKLRFAGGLTPARGHEGGNAGIDAVLSVVKSDSTAGFATTVYGCSLFDSVKKSAR
jgi:hypothetical protein